MDHNHNHSHDHNGSCCHDEHDEHHINNNHDHGHNHSSENDDKQEKNDANDYSRFNDIDDSDDEIDNQTKSTTDNKLPLEECIARASSLKDAGNDAIKKGDYNLAKTNYEDGIKLMDDHKAVTSDIVISCLSSLHLNNALACLKVGSYKNAIESSNFALKHDKDNIKALFRRGSAYIQQHSFDEAKVDLTRVLELDPDNAAAKKELAVMIKLRKEYKEKEKTSFSGLFDKKSLYVDKELERLKKIKLEEEEKERQIDLWTQSKLERRKMGLDEQTFEEWKKEKEDIEKKEKEEKAAEEEKKQKENNSPPPKEIKKQPSISKDNDDFDEEDEKILKEAGSLKGYKIVDGKKTTYFNNELDQKTKQLIGDIAPKPIQKVESVEASPVSAPVVGSVWNQAGTFEEKIMTAYATDKIKEYVSKAEAVIDNDHAVITEVSTSEGEASIIISRGKKRFIYDLKLKLDFAISNTIDTEVKKIKGSIEISDISPDSLDDNSIDIKIKFKKTIATDVITRVNAIMDALKESIVQQIKYFNLDYSKL